MIKHVMTLIAAIGVLGLSAQRGGEGEKLLAKMHERYFEKPCRSYSFSQKNTHYKADTVSGHSEWHENIEFPDKFRIVFGALEKGNKIVFKNDSVFRYKKGALLNSGRDTNTLLLLLGGMYYRTLDDVVARVRKAGYNTSLASNREWMGKRVLVIGAEHGDDASNQIWVDEQDLKVVRILETKGGSQMDMRFESHQKLCNGYIENKVSFRRNGKLEQEEEYFNVVENTPFPE